MVSIYDFAGSSFSQTTIWTCLYGGTRNGGRRFIRLQCNDLCFHQGPAGSHNRDEDTGVAGEGISQDTFQTLFGNDEDGSEDIRMDATAEHNISQTKRMYQRSGVRAIGWSVDEQRREICVSNIGDIGLTSA